MASKRECPTCRTVYTGDDKLFCPRDGSRLLDAAQAQRPDDTLVGRIIAGRFVLERRLGKGGMGVVYLANHNVLKRVFAVKLLRREFVSNERALARFFREARVTSSVDHPNIVSIYDYGQTERGEPYLVMEYVEGVLLYQAVVDSPTHNLMPAQAVDVALQVARALEHAHQRGVVHRDIKPENILLTTWNGQNDWVKVLDFGVARLIGQPPLTRIGEELIGTPEFIAPEMMAATTDVAPPVDLYALGIMLHDTIVGEPPFRGDIKGILQGHLNEVPPKLSERRGDAQILPELDALTAQLLDKDPARRPTAAETVQRLEQIKSLIPARSVATLREHTQAASGRSTDSGSFGGSRTLILGPEQRTGESMQGAVTLVLPIEASGASAKTTGAHAVFAETVKRDEIDALSAELGSSVGKLAEEVEQLGQRLWPTVWPEEAQALRRHITESERAEEVRGMRLAVLEEQLQLQRQRLDARRQELRQEILSLSEKLQLDKAMSEDERKKLSKSIEARERSLAAVLQSAPTSPEPEMDVMRRQIRELRQEIQDSWVKLAKLVLGATPPQQLSARIGVEQILGEIDAARAMLTSMTKPAAAYAR